MAFNSINRQFPNIPAFVAYLATLPLPTWGVIGSTGHNTYIPNITQWRGLASMRSMQATYEAKGWTAGPCLFIALGAPNAAHDGIFVMTPPTSEGVHGVSCNPTHFGVELVGDFQAHAPSTAQQALFLDAIAALHRYARLGPLLNMHRDCIKRTCPGDAFYALKTQLQVGLAARLSGAGLYRALAPMWISETPGPRGPIALAGQAIVFTGDTVMIDEVRPDGFCHLQNGVGFVGIGGLERL